MKGVPPVNIVTVVNIVNAVNAETASFGRESGAPGLVQQHYDDARDHCDYYGIHDIHGFHELFPC